LWSQTFPGSRSDDGDSTSETSANFYETTWCNVPEDSHLYTRRRENLKSHIWEYVTNCCRY
jgi:hypothetical protein